MDWTSEEILHFIRLYEKFPVLWDSRHGDHKHRIRLTDAWEQIQREFNPELQIADLKKKKESLMSTYRVLKKKVLESSLQGQDVYKPSWFAFAALDKFLGSRGKYASLTPEFQVADNSCDVFIKEEPFLDITDHSISPVPDTPLAKSLKRTQLEESTPMYDSMMVSDNSKVEQASTKMSFNYETQKEDAFDLFGKYIAAQLRALPPRQAILLQQDIQNSITNTLLSNLPDSQQ